MAGMVYMRFILLLSCIFSSTQALEEVVVIHSPDAVKFLSSEPVHSSSLGDIMAAMFAYTIRNKVEWNSLAVVSPWKRPEAIVVLELLGFGKKVDLPLDGERFLFENAGDVDTQFDAVSSETQERYFEKQPVLLHMQLAGELYDSKIAHPLLLKSIPANPEKRLSLALNDPDLSPLVEKSTFNTSIPSDAKLLTELVTVKELLKALHDHKPELHNAIPDVFWLKITGLQSIVTTYGTSSFQFTEALRLLRQMISEVKDGVRNVYDDNVVVMVIKEDEMPTSLASLAFKNRKLLQESTTTVGPVPEDDYNLATKWDPLFPVIFTIIAFMAIMLILSVIGASFVLWNMDPGRDSVNYRVSRQRIKKD